MRTALRIPSMILWLTILWVALWADLSWANVLAGLAVSGVVVLAMRLERPDARATYFRPHWALWYVAFVAWNLLVSNLRLAWEILTPGIGTHTGIIAVPMRGGSEAVVNLVANSITLTPGTMTVDVHSHGDIDGDGVQDGVTLYIHGMYTRDVEAVRHDVLRLEALALHAFGTPEDYARARLAVVDHDVQLADARHRARKARRR